MEFFFPSRLIFWWDLLPQKFLPLDFLQEVLISAAPLAYPVGGFLAIFAYFSIAFHGLYLVKNFLFLEPIFFREILLFAICDMPRWYGDFFFSPKLVFFRGFLQHIQTAQGVFLPPKPVLYWTFWSLRVEIWSSQ